MDLKALVVVNVNILFLSSCEKSFIVKKTYVANRLFNMYFTRKLSIHPVAYCKMT
jgi:hypothetical protein